MKPEAIEFYLSNRLPIERLVSVGRRRGLDEDSVRRSAESLYEEIQGGREIKPIRIAWEVFGRSKAKRDVKSDNEKKMISDIDALTTGVSELKAMLKEHMVPWYRRLWRWLWMS